MQELTVPIHAAAFRAIWSTYATVKDFGKRDQVPGWELLAALQPIKKGLQGARGREVLRYCCTGGGPPRQVFPDDTDRHKTWEIPTPVQQILAPQSERVSRKKD